VRLVPPFGGVSLRRPKAGQAEPTMTGRRITKLGHDRWITVARSPTLTASSGDLSRALRHEIPEALVAIG